MKDEGRLKKLKDLEEKIWRIQKSTRPLFSWMLPIHEFLRMHIRWYYKWHLYKNADLFHLLFLFFYGIIVCGFVYIIIFVSGTGVAEASTSTGEMYPGTVTNAPSCEPGHEGCKDWEETNNAKTADGLTAKIMAMGGTVNVYSKYLYLSNFNFSIPSDVVINGITINANMNSDFDPKGVGTTFCPDSGGPVYIQSSTVSLIKNNGSGGYVKFGTAKDGNWSTSNVLELVNPPYGGASDLWGLQDGTTITPAILNDPNFGVGFEVFSCDASPYLDYATINVTYTRTRTIIASITGGNGTIMPSGDVTVEYGHNQLFVLTPSTNYHVANFLIDGASIGSPSSYTFENVVENHTVAGSFAINTHTITASSGSGGSITPNGVTTVNAGSSQSYSITPDPSFVIVDVLTDGVSVGAVNSYTFSIITTNHTVSVSFARASYTIVSSTGSGGTISPLGIKAVAVSANQTYTIMPENNYHISDVLIDGGSVGSVTSYTFSNVTSDHTISVAFSIDTFTITASVSAGSGTILPEGVTTYGYGADQVYSISPTAGYFVSELLIDGTSVVVSSVYNFQNITQNHTISVGFTLIPSERGALIITSPSVEFQYYVLTSQKVIWQQSDGADRDKTDHYRVSYILNGTKTVVSDNLNKDKKEYTITLDESNCPAARLPLMFMVEAIDQNGVSVVTASIAGTLEPPRTTLTVNNAGEASAKDSINYYSVNMEINSEKSFNAAVFNQDGNVDVSNHSAVTWTVSEMMAGTISSGGKFSSNNYIGSYNNAIKVNSNYCGGRSEAYISIELTGGNPIISIIEPIISPIVEPIREIADDLGIKPATSPIVISGIAAIATGAVVVAVPIANAIPVFSLVEFIHYIWYPLLPLMTARRKKRKWGRVIERDTKLPIMAAKVLLVKLEEDTVIGEKSRKIIESTYTLEDGTYAFAADPGKYVIEVEKSNYIMAKDMINSYKPGTVIDVEYYDEGLIVQDIVMALKDSASVSKVRLIITIEQVEKFMRVVSLIVLVIGTFLAIANLLEGLTALSITMGIVYICLWIVNIFLLTEKSPWGEVTEKSATNAVPLALVRIVDRVSKKLIRTTVSNERGKFAAFVPKGKYELSATKAGFNLVKPVSFNVGEKVSAIDHKIEMEKKFNSK